MKVAVYSDRVMVSVTEAKNNLNNLLKMVEEGSEVVLSS
jgi:prevent-host-death family protein